MKVLFLGILVSPFIAIAASVTLFSTQDHDIAMQEINSRVDSSKLGVYVDLGKNKLQLKEKADFTVKIRNDGESPFYVYKNLGWGRNSSVSYIITSESGKVVKKTVVDDSRDIPPFRPVDFIELQNEQSITKERWLDMYTEGITRPGVYKLIVFYHSPVPRDFAPPNLRIWAMEDGTIQSAPVTFTVLK